MNLNTINVERDVRRRYNRRVLFCIRIKGAALLIGLWDLFIYLAALCTLTFMLGKTSNPTIDLTSMIKNQRTNDWTGLVANNDQRSLQNLPLNNNNTSSNNIIVNKLYENSQMKSSIPHSNLDFMAVKWIQSLSQQDKCIVLFILCTAIIIVLTHIWGVLTNKSSYIVPYFLIKVCNVIISILSMLGFYAYLPNITLWLRMQPDFPFKIYLLQLDTQTLQLVTFAFLLFIIIAKLYIASIIWYCYGYITALVMARQLGIFTTSYDSSQIITGEMYSPPKYEEAIKTNRSASQDDVPPPYTPLLSS